MPSQIFLKLTPTGASSPLAGAAKQAGYEHQIELLNFKWSMKVEESPTQGATTTSTRVGYKELTLSKHFDISSTALMTLMVNRTAFDQAVISVEDALVTSSNTSNNKAMSVVLRKGRVVDIKVNATESDKSITVKEDVTLSYESVEVHLFSADGDADQRTQESTFTSASASSGGSS